MNQPRYRVVFSGELLPGHDVEGVAEILAAAFKMPADRVARYFDGRPRVIRSDLDANQAESYRKAFERAGALLEVKELPMEKDPASPGPEIPQPQATKEPEPSAAPAAEVLQTMLCPKCGASQPVAVSCTHCGIIVAKFLERKAATAQTTEAPVSTGVTPPEDPAPATTSESIPEKPGANAVAPPPTRLEYDAKPEPEHAEKEELVPGAPPILELRTIRVVDLAAATILVFLLNCVVVGLLTGPRTMWDFLISHLSFDGHRLRNHDLWLGLRPLFWLLVGVVATIPAMLIVLGIGLAIPRLAVHLSMVLALPLGFFALAFLNVGVVRALAARTTTRDGDRVFPLPFTLRPGSVVGFLRRSWRSFLLGGVAMVANATLFLAPVGTAITLTQLFNLLEVEGHRYRLRVPWKKALIWSAICVPTLGLANLFFVRHYFNTVVEGGDWERLPCEPPS